MGGAKRSDAPPRCPEAALASRPTRLTVAANRGRLVIALPRETFIPLFEVDDAVLRARGIERRTVGADGGVPCRVSLVDAALGETVYLLPHVHHDVDSPYRASGPIYVREVAQTAHPAIDEIPAMLERRLLSVRGYDAQAMIIACEVIEGAGLRGMIGDLFSDSRLEYLQVHNARPGCFNCRLERAS